ncbi:hypothetical protein BBTM_00805 [Bifidobacterium bifidum]|nr:hypothetical protein BBTM_00805 [Bifidobacterium bifidum]
MRAFVCSLVCFLLDVGRRVGPSRLVPGLARESSRHGRLLHGPSDDLRPSFTDAMPGHMADLP